MDYIQPITVEIRRLEVMQLPSAAATVVMVTAVQVAAQVVVVDRHIVDMAEVRVRLDKVITVDKPMRTVIRKAAAAVLELRVGMALMAVLVVTADLGHFLR